MEKGVGINLITPVGINLIVEIRYYSNQTVGISTWTPPECSTELERDLPSLEHSREQKWHFLLASSAQISKITFWFLKI